MRSLASPFRSPAGPALHPLKGALLPVLLLCMAGLWQAFHELGDAKPWAQWNVADMLGEGGMVAMSVVWLYLMVSGRPAGRVSALLAGGLASLCLGFWVDFLDEFFRLPKAMLWDNLLESGLTLTGMLVFTGGLLLWREEQRALTERLLKRERLFRDHRGYDGTTQLADAGYMAAQIGLELQRGQAPVGILMLGLVDHQARSREHGAREADRALQAVSLLWLLNLPPDALLCRYAADRFCVLLPNATAAAAKDKGDQLRDAVAALQHHSLGGEHIALRACMAWDAVTKPSTEPTAVLRQLQQRLSA
jgi:GGDEF domain-containing protein